MSGITTSVARRIPDGSTLPANPTPGRVFMKTSGGSEGMHICFSAGTWLLVEANTGAGTVTSVSVVSANGQSGSVANPTTTPAITLNNPTALVATTSVTTPIASLGTISSVTGQLRLAHASSANLTTITAGNAAAARTYVWPTNFGAAGTVLKDAAGDGVLSWGAGGITNSAANGQVAISDGTNIVGDAGFLFEREREVGSAVNLNYDRLTVKGSGSVPNGIISVQGLDSIDHLEEPYLEARELQNDNAISVRAQGTGFNNSNLINMAEQGLVWANTNGGMSIVSSFAGPIHFATGGVTAANEFLRLNDSGVIGVGPFPTLSTMDLGYKRNADGVLEINNGTAGQYRDIILRNLSSTGYISNTAPVTKTGDFTWGVAENWIIVNQAGTTTATLPAAASFTGRILHVKTIQAQAVVSASSNVVPLVGGAAGTAILPATAGQWATLVSDATNWVIMESNG